jgi:undecaprenyl pyrophosphate phosphatase UppP
MSIPPIAAAFGLALSDLASNPDWCAQLPAYITGFIVSAAVGYVSIIAVIDTVKKGRLFVRFGIYCIALAAVSILSSLMGWV